MQRSWEEIVEDSSGGLKSRQLHLQRERKQRLTSLSSSSKGGASVIEKGVIRYLYLILDFSWCMNQSDVDMKPSRKAILLDLIDAFVLEYFDQNPLSHLGIIVGCQRLGYRISDLSGSPKDQLRLLREFTEQGGDFSQQNALELARTGLAQIPPYGSREILLVLAALSTVDPGDIMLTIDAVKQANITCSVIHMAAEMHVTTLLSTTTGGSCNVSLSRDHLRSLLFAHIPPIPAQKDKQQRIKQARKWIHMGFPSDNVNKCSE